MVRATLRFRGTENHDAQSRPASAGAGGVDNLFDKTYAEHISRAAMVSGFDQTTRINEAGRNIWIKLNVALD